MLDLNIVQCYCPLCQWSCSYATPSGVWCQENNLTLNVNKTKKMIVDFRNQQRDHPPIHIDGTAVESFKFLGVHITDKLKWSTHTDHLVKKAQQRLFNLRRLKKFGLSPKTLTNFYRCIIESILSRCTTACYCNCTTHHWGKTTCPPWHLHHPMSREGKKDHQGQQPPESLPVHPAIIQKARSVQDGDHVVMVKAGTERLKNSFYLKAIRLLNSHH